MFCGLLCVRFDLPGKYDPTPLYCFPRDNNWILVRIFIMINISKVVLRRAEFTYLAYVKFVQKHTCF